MLLLDGLLCALFRCIRAVFVRAPQLATLKNLKIAGSKSFALLGSALALNLVNQFYLEPAATANMFARYRLDDKEGATETAEYQALKKKFGLLHGLSSLANLLGFCGGVAHAFFLASGLTE